MKSNFYGNRKSLIAICFCSVFLFGNRIVCTAANHNEGEFVWYNGKQAITYSVSKIRISCGDSCTGYVYR